MMQGKFFTFPPREWPYIPERYIKPANSETGKRPDRTMKHLEEVLIHQDVISYMSDLREQTIKVLSTGIGVINETYSVFESYPAEDLAVEQLKRNSKRYSFEHF
jgi:hypothetical protein